MKTRSLLTYAAIVVFALWCGAIFRTDLARISFASLWRLHQAILVASAFSLLNYLLRALRWHHYLRRLGHHMTLRFVTLTYFAGFAFTLSPGKVGEMAKAQYYRQTGVPLSDTAAAFFVERMLDVLAMAALAALGLAALTRYTWLLAVVGAALLTALLLLAAAPWAAWRQRLDTIGLSGARRALLDSVLLMLLSARQLLQPRIVAGGFLLGLLSWALEGSGLLLLAQQLAPTVALGWGEAVSIYAIAIIVGALSFLPGGLGSTEAVMAALLSAHGYAPSDAIVITLLCRLVTLWLAVAVGWLAVAALRYSSAPPLRPTGSQR
ncbi:lysylphosphatidylglycerol synthase transmembrane domain-containing protein [Rugamonas sp.]|uniref:lysylphosphatidylglycerol synthase transmembrane domain-containing protein n=1 Tax=Rugamonas sp. TaxID=1926287 RepID=UPI0025FFA4B3|nr:lysylphosphatidylglycerol synthase transmembrane domain-containing protein [Rugamonas sp.]